MDDENLVVQDAQTLATDEKMLTQSEVNRIVGEAKASAAERARKQAIEQYQAEQAKQSAPMATPDSANIDQQIDSRVQAALQAERDKVEAEKQKLAEAEYKKELQSIATTFMQKVGEGKTAYEDFDAVTADLDIRAFPQLVFLSAGLDNPADVVYELSKNPQKLMTIQMMAERSPQMAQRQLEALSQSIKANKEALENPNNTNAPLPRIKPSTTAGADAGAMTISDLRKQPWLRG